MLNNVVSQATADILMKIITLPQIDPAGNVVQYDHLIGASYDNQRQKATEPQQ